MLKEKNRFTWILLLLFIVIGSFIVLKTHLFQRTDFSAFHGTLLDKPRIIKPFTLTGIDGKPYDQERLKGQWSILFFGFTRCGSLCPTTMAELGKMQRLLLNKNVSLKPQIVMITIDPKRDTLEKLNQYVKAFDSHFYGARGDARATHGLTQELGIAYTKVIRHSSTNSTYDDIEHTGALMLFNPKGELVAFFTPPHHAEALVEDYQLLIK